MFHSQHGQDKWVLEVLKGKRNGFFLDSGAGDPTHASNTHALETVYDWNGICVEPNPYYYEQLRQKRKCVSVNCVLDSVERQVNWISAWQLGGILEFMAPSDRERLCRDCPPLKEPLEDFAQKLNSFTLDYLLTTHQAPAKIDFWSLDVEGAELVLLKSFPWDRHSVTTLCVEHNDYEPKYTETREFMKNKGYTCYPNLLCEWEDHFVNETLL